MNSIDIVMSIVLTLSTLNGLRQGLITALANLIGWIFGLLLAFRYHSLIEPILQNYISQPALQKLVAFICIFAFVMIVSWILGYILKSIFSQLKLKWLNALTGAIFGLGKSLVIFLLLIHVLAPWLSSTQLWKSSIAIGYLQPFSSIATEYSQKIVQKTTEELEQVKSDTHNDAQSVIMLRSTSDSKSQVDNPFL